jgi:glycosyltransferase involved in cell wall biosynthesis
MIALDLSRLLSRAGFATPTGIDRVELAYARHLLASGGKHCFAAINAVGAIGALPWAGAARFVEALEATWCGGATLEEAREIKALARRLSRAALLGGVAKLQTRLRAAADPVYLLVSHSLLHRARGIARLKRASGARFVCLIHDLIPLDYPQFTSRAQTARHRRRIETVTALADSVVVNSAATQASLCRRLERDLPVTVAPLGLDLAVGQPETAKRPYFVCLGTIEPRKNHTLLLDIWQCVVAERGEQAPRLLLVGRRGWGSGKIAARLPGLYPFVEEQPDLPDRALRPLLRGAPRALLMPSFAEGFGLPVIEALAQGAPVLCSELPALRESGDGAPDYLDPADAAAWRAAILDYAIDSPRRQAQLARLGQWRAPLWEEHFAVVDQLLAKLTEAREFPQ